MQIVAESLNNGFLIIAQYKLLFIKRHTDISNNQNRLKTRCYKNDFDLGIIYNKKNYLFEQNTYMYTYILQIDMNTKYGSVIFMKCFF